MKNYSYTKSAALAAQINVVEKLRSTVLLTPIMPAQELQLQWTALLNHIHYSLAFKGISLQTNYINNLFSPTLKKSLTLQDKIAIEYKKALDMLYHEWLGNEKQVTVNDLKSLYALGFRGKVKASDEEVNRILQYVQLNAEHPTIQAALAQFLILDEQPFSEDNERFSHLVLLLFLYKSGYDFKRLLVPEEYFFTHIVAYRDTVGISSRQANLTFWLEYVTDGIVFLLNKINNTIINTKQNWSPTDILLKLNTRQQSILSLLEKPGIKISNKTVQHEFAVSQITASRDLSKLASLGLITPLGKGRSTYYTKER